MCCLAILLARVCLSCHVMVCFRVHGRSRQALRTPCARRRGCGCTAQAYALVHLMHTAWLMFVPLKRVPLKHVPLQLMPLKVLLLKLVPLKVLPLKLVPAGVVLLKVVPLKLVPAELVLADSKHAQIFVAVQRGQSRHNRHMSEVVGIVKCWFGTSLHTRKARCGQLHWSETSRPLQALRADWF